MGYNDLIAALNSPPLHRTASAGKLPVVWADPVPYVRWSEATLFGGVPCATTTISTSTSRAFERTSKRRRGFPSETHVKRGLRVVHGDKELVEKLGRNDPCPCGSNRCF